MMEKQIYSYHTFLFPFLLKNPMTKKQFCEQLNALNFHWEKADMICGSGEQLSAVEDNNLKKARLDYQTFQYFNPAARKALFEKDGGIVSSYNLKNAKGGTYEIQYGNKENESNESQSYVLDIDAICLKVFNTGVAVISFELEYPMPKEGAVQARKNVKIINEFGRRLYPAFLVNDPKESNKKPFLLCADNIKVTLADGQSVLTKLRENALIDTGAKADANVYLKHPIHLPEIITKITGVKEQDIEPAIDDRMFVCCCILDNEYAESFIRMPSDETDCFATLQQQEHKWRFMEDWDTGCELYALTNIDANDSSCQNRVMLDQYFEEQLYLRWIEWGTFHAVTNHSMICLTGDPKYVMDSVVNPFLIEYVPMCILVQVQRASLLLFDDRITETIQQSKLGVVEGKMLDDLIKIEEDFAVFQGQLLLQEVTPQIQGIELYERLQKMLFIEKLSRGVQRHLNNLYEISESKLTKQQEEERLRKAMEEKEKGRLQEEREKRETKMQETNSKRIELFFAIFASLSVIPIYFDLINYLTKYKYLPDCISAYGMLGKVIISIVAIIITVIIIHVFVNCIYPRKKGKNE